jgi:alkylation response protein AidB-like acyl-CoA dehydrogenase
MAPLLDEPAHVAAVRATSREVATRIAPFADDAERTRRIPDAVRTIMAEGGCLGRAISTEPGAGSGLYAFAAQQEELARVWPSAAVAATWTNLSGRLIGRFGTAAQRDELIPPMARGVSSGAIGWTEPQGGSDASALVTTAVRAEGGWRLDGTKRLIDNSRDADFFVVGARSAAEAAPRNGLSMFLVHRDDPGFVFGGTYDTLGLRPCGVGWFTLDGCVLDGDRLLGEPGRGFYQMMDMVEFGRVGVAAVCLGIAEATLAATVSYLGRRGSFGSTLSRNDALIARIAELRTKLDAARLLTARAALMADAGRRCSRESAMAKLFTSELALETTAAALQLHGGIGYTSELPIERFFRDARAFTVGEGTSEVMRMIIGRAEFANPDS